MSTSRNLSFTAALLVSLCAGGSAQAQDVKDSRETILARPATAMGKFDSNTNPQDMTREEFRVWRDDTHPYRAAFNAMDLNKDGVVTLEESQKAIAKKVDAELTMELGPPGPEAPAAMTADHFKDFYAGTDPEFVEEVNKKWVDLHPSWKPLKIRQTLLQDSKDVASPARFSWTRDNEANDSYYTVDGAISYEFNIGDTLFLSPTVEAHLSTQSKNERDSLTFALPLTASFAGSGAIDGHYIKGIGSYNTDREQNVETTDASLLYSFDLPAWGIGVTAKPRGIDHYPQFIWRPWVGADYGHVQKDGGVAALEADDSFFRLHADLEASLWLADNFAISGRFIHLTYLTGLEDSYNYGEISAVLYLDKDQYFSLGATYKIGEAAPKFEDVDSFTAWLGIKF